MILTSLCSAFLTALAMYLVYRFKLKKEIDDTLDEVVIKAREQIKEGLKEAGRDLMPDFREEVSAGFKDAMSSAMKGEIISKSAQDMARTGSEIVESGMQILFGLKKPGS